MKLIVLFGFESGGEKNPCLTYDSRPDEATKEPVGRFESDKRRRMYVSEKESIGTSVGRRSSSVSRALTAFFR